MIIRWTDVFIASKVSAKTWRDLAGLGGMHRRHQHINIPTELVRTLVVIGETHSFSKAGEKLGLSQPAISAQVKRLQIIIGGAAFQKSGHGGLELTPRGRMVLAHARKLLDANDQILSLVGAVGETSPIRLGLAALYAEPFLAAWKSRQSTLPLHFHCDGSAAVSKGLGEGFLDIGCVLDTAQQTEHFATSWEEEMVWVRSADFVVSPGAPIPLISWPGGYLDNIVTSALDNAGVAYRIVFTSADHHARMMAVAAGVGIMGLMKRRVTDPLMIANEYYLPKLSPARAGIAIRPGFDVTEARELIDTLTQLAPQEDKTVFKN